MEMLWGIVSQFWPMLLVVYVALVVAVSVGEKLVHKFWPNRRQRQLRKQMLPVVVRLRELRNLARLDRHIQELKRKAESLERINQAARKKHEEIQLFLASSKQERMAAQCDSSAAS